MRNRQSGSDRRRQSHSRRVRDQPWARVLMLEDLYSTTAPASGRILQLFDDPFDLGRNIEVWRATDSSGTADENDIIYAALVADANRWEILRPKQGCTCTACTGKTPVVWIAALLGVDYNLKYNVPIDGTGNICRWTATVDVEIDGQDAVQLELRLDCSSPGLPVSYILKVLDAAGDLIRSYVLADGADCQTDCSLPRDLAKVGGDPDTATITPVALIGPCCDCEFDVGSGSGGLLIPDNGCCLTMPSAWNLEFPTPVWGNQSCGNCTGVVGVFNLPFLDAPPLVGTRYRYFNANWCTDTVVPCVGGTISLEITLTFTVGCGLRAQLNLDRQLLDHEVCAARCRVGYTANNFTPPRNCVASPITLTANNYPNANPCSSRTAGGPPPSPFDTLCNDYTDGAFPPEFITATAA